MNGKKDGRKRRNDRLSEGMIPSAPTWKTYRALLKRCRGFLKTQRAFLKRLWVFFKTSRSFWKTPRSFFAAWECVKTKPGYPIVSCRGRVRLPEDTKQTVFGRANLALTHETTALSTFCPPVCKVCSVYVRIGLHIRWHKPTRTYASAYTYVRMSLHVYMSLCQAPSYSVPGLD